MGPTEPRYGPHVAILGGALVAVAVAWPVLPGRLFLLDWVTGPRAGLIPPEAFGLNGGLTAGLPFSLSIDSLVARFGAAGTWIPLLCFFPLASFCITRLVRGSTLRQLAAALLYCVNPFVFNRIYVGHFGLLLGYALLPLATGSAFRFFKSARWWLPMPALWWAILTALSPHFAWIFGIVVIVAWLTHRPFRPAIVARLAMLWASFIALSAYLLLPHGVTQVKTGTGSLLTLYRTSGDPGLGLFPNVAGLYGFWRLGPGPVLPKGEFSGWPYLLVAILVIVGVGVFHAFHRGIGGESSESEQVQRRHFAVAMLIIGILGYLLALGGQGPTGAIFRLAYFHAPFFAIMEEPQKFLMLTALAYAVFFGYGIDRLAGRMKRVRVDWTAAGAACLAILLPIAYTPTIFGGLNGQLSPSHLPSSWGTADRLMGNGTGTVLFLPWHLYLGFPFTGGRVIASPAPTSFRRGVISGDNFEAGGIESTSTSPRSAYLQRLYAQGPAIQDFGRRVAPLGVQYVVLAKTVDWARYDWLKLQTDLVPVMDSGGLQIWRNADYAGVGQAPHPRTIRQISPVAYSIGPGPPGEVTLDAVYQEGWQLGTQKAQETPQGTIRFHVGSRGGIVQFTPWGITRLGYIVSGSTFVALLGVVIGDRRWRGGRNQRRTGPRTGLRDANPSCPG